MELLRLEKTLKAPKSNPHPTVPTDRIPQCHLPTHRSTWGGGDPHSVGSRAGARVLFWGRNLLGISGVT